MARRYSDAVRPGATKIVTKAMRPPGRSNRRQALSTESFAWMHQSVSA
jgi:hypothetical protein